MLSLTQWGHISTGTFCTFPGDKNNFVKLTAVPLCYFEKKDRVLWFQNEKLNFHRARISSKSFYIDIESLENFCFCDISLTLSLL